MQACELVTYITAIACAISKCCTEDELEILASVFSQLGDTLATISLQNQLCNKNADD